MFPPSALGDILGIYKKEFRNHLEGHESIADILDFLLQSEGKAIRPQLLLTFCSLLGCHDEDRFKIAVATEYIHTASLIHDDIIDGAISRRNQETLHQKWGVKNAILIGDFLYSRAFELICESKYSDVLALFANAANRLSISEINQLDINQTTGMRDLEDQEVCLNIMKEKTAILFGVVCEAAIVISTVASTQENNKMASYRQAAFDYGMNLGMAFQLMDDYLDYSAGSSKWGKRRLNDISEGKITLPLVYLYQSSSQADKDHILQVLTKAKSAASNSGINIEADIDSIDNMMKASSVPQQIIAMAKEFGSKAAENIKTFPQTKESESLCSLALTASSRDY
ncbi:MAG: polyprenyl synthetase family protein [Gammaproteobacteria bacterium]|nr:polyprenyl synthetase family protein [Gammaproteobacteria bacterium]